MLKILLLSILFIFNLQAKENNLKIIRITPNNEVNENINLINQIIIEFNLPMVALGNINHQVELPIIINPEIQCKWQWINVTTALCPLEKNLKSSTQYNIQISPELQTFDNIKLNKEFSSSFITIKPQVDFYRIIKWKNASTPIFQLEFNQFIAQNTNLENLYLIEIETKKKFKLNLLDEKLYSSEEDLDYRETELKKFLETNNLSNINNIKKTIFIEPISILEEGKKFKLMLDKNINSAEGDQKWAEDQEILTFETFSKPKFLGIKCIAVNPQLYRDVNHDPHIIILPNELEVDPDKKCLPEGEIYLLFNSPVETAQVVKFLKFSPDLNEKVENAENSYDNPEHKLRFETRYWQPQPYNFEVTIGQSSIFSANQKYKISYIRNKPNIFQRILNFIFNKNIANNEFKDYFGRPFESEFTLNFALGDKLPEFELNHISDNINNEQISFLATTNKNDLNLGSRNIISYDLQYNFINHLNKVNNKLIHKLIESKANGFIETNLNIREILDYQDGLLNAKLSLTPLDYNYGNFNLDFLVQVSNFNIIAKIGHYNNLIWVTNFENNKPISNAKVTIKKVELGNIIKGGDIIASGITDQNGLLILEALPKLDISSQARFLIEVKKEENLGWLLVKSHEGLIYYDNNLFAQSQPKFGHLAAYGFTTNQIYRAGEKVNYKFYVRNHENNKLGSIDDLTYNLLITDPQNKIVREEKNIVLSKFGSQTGQFTLDDNALSGTYQIKISPNLKEKNEYVVAEFIVNDTSKPNFLINTKLDKKFALYQDELKIENHAELYAGGDYKNAAIAINISLNPLNFNPQLPLAKKFQFNNNSVQTPVRIFRINDKLNNQGVFNSQTIINNDKIPYGQLEVETLINEDNGSTISKKTNLPYYGTNQFIGLKSNKWLYQLGDKQIIELIALDGSENILENLELEIKIEQINLENGNLKLIETCKVHTNKDISHCIFNIKAVGNYQVTSMINGQNKSQISFIIDNFNNSFNPDSKIIEIIPEKDSYQLGEVAHFMVKNPIINGKALITIERYGVIEQYIKILDKAVEIIEVPLNKEEYAPGFYLSVIILNQENTKLGYSKILVDSPNNKINLNIETDKEIYKPGEEVDLKLSLNENNQADEIETTILVVDQALLDLQINNDYYFLCKKFNQLQNLDMLNFSSVNSLNFNSFPMARLAYSPLLSASGDFSANEPSGLRSNFQNLAFYQKNLILEKNKTQEIKFNLPDDLTQWRIIVISADKNSLFGLNEKNIKVNKLTEIRSLLPNHLLTSDEVLGNFSIFNRSDQERNIKYEIKTEGSLKNSDNFNQKGEIKISPEERKLVEFTLKLSDNIKEAQEKIKINITVEDELDSDQLESYIDINRAVTNEVSINESVITNNNFSTSLEPSKEIIGNLSSLQINISNTISANIESIFNYAKDIESDNWEEKLTKLFIAHFYLDSSLNSTKNQDGGSNFEWPEAKQIIENNLKEMIKYQTSQGGISYYENGLNDPYLSVATLWAANKINIDLPTEFKEELITYLDSIYEKEDNLDLKTMIIEALNKDKEIKLMENYWSEMSLFAKGKILNSLINFNDYNQENINLITKWWNDLLNYSHQAGSFISFSDKNKSNKFFHPYRSNQVDNCNILNTALNLKNKLPDLVEINFIANLVNHILNRNKFKNYNVPEAIICMNALSKYHSEYEKTNEVDEAILTIQINNQKPEIDEEIEIPNFIEINDLSRFIDKKTSIQIIKDKEYRNLYFSAKLSSTLQPDFKNKINKGIGIERSYWVKKSDEKWIAIQDQAPIIGDIIKVSLKINAPSDLHFVKLEDYIPGCFIPVNPALNQNNYNFYFQDINKNSAKFYSEFLPNGIYNIDYYVQLIAKGTYTILPTIIYETYNKEIYGQTNAMKMVLE